MPPALDRLLASPSALRLLRSIVAAPELPACHTTVRCCAAKSAAAQRRAFGKRHGPSTGRKWKRWDEQKVAVMERKHAMKTLLGDDAAAQIFLKQDQPQTGFDFFNDVLEAEEDELADYTDVEDLIEDEDKIWAARLARHERLDGLEGIKAIWYASRKQGYCLPIENTVEAQLLWRTFARHPNLVRHIIEHAAELQQEKGETYPHLYDFIMGHWLKRKPTDAMDYHHEMLVKLRLERLPLRELARAIRHYGPAAQDALLYIYRTSGEYDMYDEVVPRLISCGNIKMARRWHKICVFRRDFPSPTIAAHPVVQVFNAEASTLAQASTLTESEVRLTKVKRENPTLNKHLMQRLLGRDSAPVRFEDSFTARMFATRTVPIKSIIKGLTMVGVNEIGPQAVLTMARRTQPITELPHCFDALRAAGIALQGSVFSLALEKFVMEQKWDLVQSMLDSDQHPDVYGDADVQRSLLTYYLDQKELKQAQRTLAILALFHNDTSRESWNLLLQLRIKRSMFQDAFNTMLEMRSLGITLSSPTMASVKYTMARRWRGHLPSSHRGFDDLRFVARFYVTALEAGMTRIPPQAWYEIIRRFGMLGRFRELRRLLLWLLSWYAPCHSTEFPDLPRSTYFEEATSKLRRLYPVNRHYYNFPADVPQESDKDHPIRLLFPPSLQQGIIVWGFRSSLLRNAPLEQSMLGPVAGKRHQRRNLIRKGVLQRLHWVAGLRLLVQLRDLNVRIHPHTVIKALQAQLVNLFGYGHSRIKANRMMEQSNTTPYAEYVRMVNTTWGTPLLTEPEMLGRGELLGALWHPRFKRRVDRKRDVSLRQTMGEEWAGGSKSEQDEEQGEQDAFEGLEAAAEAHAEEEKR